MISTHTKKVRKSTDIYTNTWRLFYKYIQNDTS